METYYHINWDNNCNWKVGDEIDLFKEDNNYWRSFAEKGEQKLKPISLQSSVLPINFIYGSDL